MHNHEPFKTKTIRQLNFYSISERQRFLRNVKFNVGLLPVSAVTFGMTTQGTSAMSQEQVGSLFIGDEAYAGARNFQALEKSVKEVFDFKYVCPLHNRYGGIKLLCSIHVKKGAIIAGNNNFPKEVVEFFGGEYHNLTEDRKNDIDGNININELEKFLKINKGKVPFLYIDLNADGYSVITKENLEEISGTAGKYNVRLVLDVSCITEYTYRISNNKSGHISFKSALQEIAKCGNTILFDAAQDAMSNIGGFLAADDFEEHERYQNEVVVYEGLHTYGGMAGRTMEVVAAGVREMADINNAEWTYHQAAQFAETLKKSKVPFTRGFNGVYLHADEFLPRIKNHRAHTLAASLYLICGLGTHLDGRFTESSKLPVLIPRRALRNTHLEETAQAIISLYKQRDRITPLELINDPKYHYEAEFEWLIPNLNEYEFDCEPYITHSIEHIGMKSKQERQKAVKEASYNTFLLMSEDVTIDFLTDSGTSAMSVEQWLAYLSAQETPGTPDEYHDIVEAAVETYGHKYVILTHQGRAAEHIMSQMFIKDGDYVPGNMYFTTTKLHQEIAGGTFVDVIVDDAHDTSSEFMWKGNIDLNKLENLYEKAQKEGRKIAYISFEFNVNMAGGQPVSMDNIKEVYTFCRPRNIPVFFDGTRCAENARFIQMKDPDYADVPIADILLEMYSYGDGATISSKKDMLTNISGMLLFRDNEEWYTEAQRMLQLFEGPYRSGGTSAGDMAAHAQGLFEMVDDAYIASRVSQTEYLGKLLKKAGVPIVLPPGGHAIFLNARDFLSHIDQDLFPAQMLAAQLFVETGVRAMERGNVSKGRNPETGENYRPALELVRLTIPRRVYSSDHIFRVAEGIIGLYNKRSTIKGLKFTYEPEKLRFFQGRFEEIE